MTGYVRVSSGSIIDGATIHASDSNNEYNAIQTAFDATAGHAHDASSGSAPKIVLTTSVAGTLPVANGGTGAVTLASNGVLLGNTTSAISATTAGTADQVLRIPHAGGAPAFGTVDISKTAAVTGTLAVTNGGTGVTSFTDGQLLIGNTTGNTLAAATLTAGTSISITNGSGAITVGVTGLAIGTNVQAWDADLDALAAMSSTGYVKRTGTATYSVGTAISLTADVSGILPVANGGTGMAYFTVAGPAASAKTFTFPNASSTVLTDNALVTAAQGGTANGFFAVSGPASTTKTFTFPNASANVLTDNAVVTVAQGGTGTTTAAGARTNLGAAASAITLTAGNGLTGGGDLSANRSFAMPDVGPGAATTGNITTDAQGRVTAIVARDYIRLEDQETQNTAGGTFTSGAWRTRVLNTEVTDTGSLCTLATNQFTLAAGTYEIRATAPTFNAGRHQARLQNTTAASTILTGTSNIDGTNTMGCALVQGRFTVAASQALELQHQCGNTEASDGFGVAANFSTEVYAVVEVWRVA